MKISVQSIHFNADRKLLRFIQRKADKLEQFLDNVISGEVYLRLQKTDDDENKVVVMKLNIPGASLFAKEQCRTFEEAVDLTFESLRRQADKYKPRMRRHISNYKDAFAQQVMASV